MVTEQPPTLDEIRTWPAACTIEQAAAALQISRSHAYVLARTDQFPARVVRAGRAVRVSTASLIKVLTEGD